MAAPRLERSQHFLALLDLAREAHLEEIDALNIENIRLKKRLTEAGLQSGEDEDEDQLTESRRRSGRFHFSERNGSDSAENCPYAPRRDDSSGKRVDTSLLDSVLGGQSPGKLSGTVKAGSKVGVGLLARGTSAAAISSSLRSSGTKLDAGDNDGTTPKGTSKSVTVDLEERRVIEEHVDRLDSEHSRGSLIDRVRTFVQSPISRGSARSRRTTLPFQKKPSASELGLEFGWTSPCPMIHSVVNSKFFEPFFAMLILINALMIAAEAQIKGWQVGIDLEYPNSFDPGPGVQSWFRVLGWVFGCAFTLEIVLKMVGMGKLFFEEVWNYFDALIVVFWILEVAFESTLPLDPSLLRIIRLMRLLRLLRLVRTIQGFDALYLMTTALSGSATILAWSAALLVVLLMTLALLANQVLIENYIQEEEHSLDKRVAVYEYFGTFSRALLSLFEMTLANWPPVCRLLVENVSEVYLIPALIHKLTIGFAVVGVINGVFMQETFKVAATDDRIMVRQKERAIKTHELKMQTLFERADESGDGCLDFEEFRKVVEDEGISTWLASMDLDASDIRTLFDLIDNGDQQITAKELIKGVSRLKGSARSIDLAVLMRDHRNLREGFNAVTAAVTDMRTKIGTIATAQEKIEKETMATAAVAMMTRKSLSMHQAHTESFLSRAGGTTGSGSDTLGAVEKSQMSGGAASQKLRRTQSLLVTGSERPAKLNRGTTSVGLGGSDRLDRLKRQSSNIAPTSDIGHIIFDPDGDGDSDQEAQKPSEDGSQALHSHSNGIGAFDEHAISEAVLEASCGEDVDESTCSSPKVRPAATSSPHHELISPAAEPAAWVI